MVQFLSSVLESLGSRSRVAKGKQAVPEVWESRKRFATGTQDGMEK